MSASRRGGPAVLLAFLLALSACTSAGSPPAGTSPSDGGSPSDGPSPSPSPTPTPRPTSFGLGFHTVTFVDRSRMVLPPHTSTGAPEPRTLVTDVWYPASPNGRGVRAGAVPDRADGPYPLVVFAHGFDVAPTTYAPMLEGIARAGFVVAAPVFPLTNPAAPGGPDEADMVNQPADVSFVLGRLIERDHRGTGFLRGLIRPSHVAVAGQSDGGDTVLAVAYGSCCRDARVRAAVVMSGERAIPGDYFVSPGPPLLAFQGTADPINPPSFTDQFFAEAGRPKYLVRLLDAGHLQPYTERTAWERVVVRTTVAFLDRYLRNDRSAYAAMRRAARVPGVATLSR